jgi:hypothetical protein
MSCRCPIQPDYCVDEPITTLDCAACTTCVLSMNADSLRTVLAHRDRLIERLHATRSTLMAERDSALDQRNEARFLAENLRDGLLTTPRYRSGAGAEPVMDLPWEVVEWHDSTPEDVINEVERRLRDEEWSSQASDRCRTALLHIDAYREGKARSQSVGRLSCPFPVDAPDHPCVQP